MYVPFGLVLVSIPVRHPPVRQTRGDGGKASKDVHDYFAEREEVLGREVLGEEIREVLVRTYEGNAYGVVLDDLADVEVASCDVLVRSWCSGL